MPGKPGIDKSIDKYKIDPKFLKKHLYQQSLG